MNSSLFILDVIYDDGLAVYVNGVEYVRDLLPADAEFDDWALDDVSNEREFKTFVVPAEAFVAGRNVIAVEVHQESETSSDVSFDMEIRAEQKSADVDSYEFVIEQSDVGSPFSVYLAGIHADFSDETLQLIGQLVRCWPQPTLVTATTVTLRFSDFVANQPGTYKIQLKSFARGDYGIMVTNGLVYENETLTGSSISVGQLAFGHLASGAAMDLSDQFSVLSKRSKRRHTNAYADHGLGQYPQRPGHRSQSLLGRWFAGCK